MPRSPFAGWTPKHALLLAEVSCLLLAIGMILGGLAPIVIDRLLTGKPQPLQAFAVSLGGFLVACIFLGVVVLIRQRRLWSLWVAYGLSVTMFLMSVASILLGAPFASSYLLAVSAITAFATWLALETNVAGRSRPRRRRA